MQDDDRNRLECLRLAVSLGEKLNTNAATVVEIASKFYVFVSGNLKQEEKADG